MRYRLDPGLPVTLCSSTQLRIGDSDAQLTLPDTPLVRTLIELAQLGTTRAELLTDAQKWALQRRQPTEQLAELVDLLLGVCEPIALRDPTNRQLLIRTTAASRPLAELIAGSVNLQGHRVAIGDEHTNPADLDPLPDVVVDVAERMLAPRRYLHMASLQIPQLAIVRETARDLIGPLSLPPVTPCPNCDELHRVASELGWFAVATQLAASPPPTDSDTRRWCGRRAPVRSTGATGHRTARCGASARQANADAQPEVSVSPAAPKLPRRMRLPSSATNRLVDDDSPGWLIRA